MLHERNVPNVVITIGLASIRARHSADLATELGFGVKSFNSKTGRGSLNGRENKMPKHRKLLHWTRIIAELNTFWSVLNACTVERQRLFYFSTPWAFHLRGAHTTAYGANVCRRTIYFVHTLVYRVA